MPRPNIKSLDDLEPEDPLDDAVADLPGDEDLEVLKLRDEDKEEDDEEKEPQETEEADNDAVMRMARRAVKGPGADRVRKGQTISSRELANQKNSIQTLRDGKEYLAELIEIETSRPKTRADCKDGLRPCPYAGCRHHLLLDVNPQSGSILLNFPDQDFDEIPDTCALDVAELGGITLEDVGELMNLTRERVRQIEVMALKTVERRADVTMDSIDGADIQPREKRIALQTPTVHTAAKGTNGVLSHDKSPISKDVPKPPVVSAEISDESEFHIDFDF